MHMQLAFDLWTTAQDHVAEYEDFQPVGLELE
jgi:hypothetical protein